MGLTISPHPPSPVLTHRQTETIPSQPESFGIKVSPHFNTMIIKVPLPTLLLGQKKSKLNAFESDVWRSFDSIKHSVHRFQSM